MESSYLSISSTICQLGHLLGVKRRKTSLENAVCRLFVAFLADGVAGILYFVFAVIWIILLDLLRIIWIYKLCTYLYVNGAVFAYSQREIYVAQRAGISYIINKKCGKGIYGSKEKTACGIKVVRCICCKVVKPQNQRKIDKILPSLLLISNFDVDASVKQIFTLFYYISSLQHVYFISFLQRYYKKRNELRLKYYYMHFKMCVFFY